MQYKLVLLAKENIILDTLLGLKPKMMDIQLKPIYEETIIGSSAQSERERNARNAQQTMIWQKQVSTSDRHWYNVWRQAMVTCGSQNSVSFLFEYRSGRTSDLKL